MPRAAISAKPVPRHCGAPHGCDSCTFPEAGGVPGWPDRQHPRCYRVDNIKMILGQRLRAGASHGLRSVVCL